MRMRERDTLRPRLLRTGMAMGLAALGAVSLTGCHLDMWIQPKAKPLQNNSFFDNGMASRPEVPHTVIHIADSEPMRTDNPFYTGFSNGKLVRRIPAQALQKFNGSLKTMMERGKDRFTVFCTPCHGGLGDGNGMIALRGFSLRRQPGNYHTRRLMEAPDGHFFDVMTQGFGAMYSYAERIPAPEDRWAIVAYIRALQLSQHATLNDVPPEERQKLEAAPGTPTGSEPVRP